MDEVWRLCRNQAQIDAFLGRLQALVPTARPPVSPHQQHHAHWLPGPTATATPWSAAEHVQWATTVLMLVETLLRHAMELSSGTDSPDYGGLLAQVFTYDALLVTTDVGSDTVAQVQSADALAAFSQLLAADHAFMVAMAKHMLPAAQELFQRVSQQGGVLHSAVALRHILSVALQAVGRERLDLTTFFSTLAVQLPISSLGQLCALEAVFDVSLATPAAQERC